MILFPFVLSLTWMLISLNISDKYEKIKKTFTRWRQASKLKKIVNLNGNKTGVKTWIWMPLYFFARGARGAQWSFLFTIMQNCFLVKDFSLGFYLVSNFLINFWVLVKSFAFKFWQISLVNCLKPIHVTEMFRTGPLGCQRVSSLKHVMKSTTKKYITI